MKKLLFVFLTLSLIFTLTFSVAAEASPRLVDGADILSSSEETNVLQELDRVSEKLGVDIVIVTVDSLNGQTVEDASKSTYEMLGYKQDGIILLVDMESRFMRVQLFGSCYDYLSDGDCSDIREEITEDMSEGYYERAFLTFAEECDDYVTDATHFPIAKKILISLVIGVIIAFIVTSILKGQLKTVRHQSLANDYLRAGSFNVTMSNDLFLYRNITRRRRQTNNSSGGSGASSGGRSGGSSGRF